MKNEKILTVLIPTHNRPKLFKRCIESVFFNKPECVDVIVNNDSFDVSQVYNEKIFYNKFQNLTEIYKFLAHQATTKYIYFLEDDDILLKGFYKVIDFLNDYDAITGSYISVMKGFKNKYQKFNIESDEYQLSQVIFKKEKLNFDGLEKNCLGNCIFNDYYLFKNSFLYNIYNSKIFFYKQTTDGNDNISFEKFTDLTKCKKCNRFIL